MSGELLKLTKREVEKHFAQYPKAEQFIGNLLYELQTQLAADTEQRVRELMAMERDQLWTQNDHYLHESKTKFLDSLTEQLYATMDANLEAQLDHVNRQASAALTALGLTLKDLRQVAAKKQHAAQGNTDSDLLDKIAGTLAYFKVSSKRVYDVIPMQIKFYLLSRYCELLESLPARLSSPALGRASSSPGADDTQSEETSSCTARSAAGGGDVLAAAQQVMLQLPASLESLMEEEGSISEKRKRLQKQNVQLREVRQILQVF